ncbi:Bug family tripartite tricarboxylate transporter substrate binding protein [Diaphorobacter aerolatus]|uniref:Tripartite tricarboxylate transporter substrate binding protein n=1 Tax=Diaphorobacter aerolatus TaxID=1288495 RepID=A0A7H0GHV6_9BURK|nr:tripartite tricarboxylate transporter substrate binding protein [Diaphorobacter aerolatus]QNP47872.1 tripartite tricarboxylate transporter substrate binding protein [Diaphorobacter aerolatus]
MKISRVNIALLSLGLGLAGAAHAQEAAWPTKPVLLIMPYTAGGPADAILRAIAPDLQKRWGQPLVIDYKPGANEVLGAMEVAKAKPDGYTLLIATDATYALNPLLKTKLAFNPEKDFAPVSLMMRAPLLLVTSPQYPANTVKELVEYARKHPEKSSYASTGIGGSNHLAMSWFNKQNGIQSVHAPYNNLSLSLQDVAAGRVDMSLVVTGGARAFLEKKNVKPLAVSGSHRQPLIPDVPTFAEAGFKDYEASVYFGLAAPAGTPLAIRQRIAADIGALISAPEFQKKYLSIYGFDAVGSTPEAFAAFLQSDKAATIKRIEAAGVQPE